LLSVAPAIRAADEAWLDTVLYGASYYHEYMPYERLEKDAQLMEAAGVTVVRVGESTWSSWEPREGEFEFDWIEKVIERMHQAGIKVILGTPTYSIPPWLYRKHPEILVTPLGQVRTAPWQFYGPRQNMDITHPTYLHYAERVIRQVVSKLKDHPAVIGYQIDNETSAYGTAGRNVQIGFVDYLKKKFGKATRLNELWGFAYWGQLVNDWDEFPPRDGALNPGYKLEWERYQQKLTTDFLAWQAGIVDEYKRPDQFVMQDFVGGVRTNIDEFAIAQHLDVVGKNAYHEVQGRLDGYGVALGGDLAWSLKRASYLNPETNAQTIGWASSAYQYPPYDGQARLNVYSHLASGADMVAYWHWHSLHYGNETFWKGVLSHDLEPNRFYREMSRIGRELKKVGPKLVGLRKENRVALLYSVDSYHGLQFMPFDNKGGRHWETEIATNYMTILNQLARTLYDLNVGMDFVFPRTTDLSGYDVLVVPPLYIADDALLERLVAFVERGGHLLLTFKSGFCDEHSRVRWTRAPGPLREAAGFSYQEFSTLREPVSLKGDPYGVGETNRASIWAEMLVPEGAETLAVYDHPFFGDYPALTRNRHGQGTLTYEGTVLSDELQEKIVLEVLELAGLTGPDQGLPEPVRLRQGVSRGGKRLRYYLNYSDHRQTFPYPHASGTDVLTGQAIEKGADVTLEPWDLVIVEEASS
jgi:beta-galactosidase